MKRFSLLAVSMLLTCTLFAADIFLRGSVSSWGASDDFKFSTSDNVVYTLEKSFDLFGEFKFADAAWGDHNYGSGGTAVALETELSLAQGGGNFNCGTNSYAVTKIVLDLSKMTAIIYGKGGELEITSHTVVGESTDIFGTAWAPTDTDNDMVKGSDGTWTLTKENISLLSGTDYEFKIVSNHAWGIKDCPTDASNMSFSVSESGYYDVNFEYDETTNTGKAYATKKTEPTTFDSYILVGDKALFMFDWTPSPIGVDLFTLETTDGIHYSKTVNGVPLNTSGTFAYGFSKNASTTDILFKDKSLTVTIDEAGTYNISVALTVAPGEEPVAQAKLTKVTPGTTYYIAGNGTAETDWCCGLSWNEKGCPMEDGYYTRDLPAGTYEFKITDGTWDTSWGYSDVDAAQSTAGYTDNFGNVAFTLDKYSTVAVKFDGSKIILQWTAKDEPVPPVYDRWTILGDMPPFPVSWDVDAAFDLQTTDGIVYTLSAKAIELPAKFNYGFAKNGNKYDYAPLDPKYRAELDEGAGYYDIDVKIDFTDYSDPDVQVTFTKNVTPTFDYYITGNGSTETGWCCGKAWEPAGCGMADGTYTVKVPKGTYSFKITNGAWEPEGQCWGYESVDATASNPGYESDGTNVKFSVPSEANITVSFNGTSIILTSDVPFGEATIDSWTVVGDAGLFAKAWDPTDTSNDLTFVGGVYQITKTGLSLEAKTYNYKFVANHQWGVSEIPSGNADLEIEEAGTYKVTFSLNPATGEYSAVPEKQVDPGYDTWTLVGDMPPFPAAWDPTMTAFDLQTTDGVIYTMVEDDVDMTVEQFQYGFRKNHTNEYAPLEEKYKVSLAEGVGSYKVQITLDFTDATNPQVDVQFTKNVTPTYDYYIAGNGDGLNGWTCGITWAADGCGMAEGQYAAHVQPGTYEFKVTDGTWDKTWGIESVDATKSTPGYEGTDNVKFTVNAEANISVTFDGTSIVLTSDVPFGEATITSWTAVGEAGLFENAWTPTDESNDMQFVGGVYQLVKTGLTLEAKDYLYKFTANHTWSVSEIPSGNATLTIEEAGTYKVTFSLNPATGEYSAVPEKQVDPGYDTWTLVGDMPPFPVAWTAIAAFDLKTTDGVVYTLSADDVDMPVAEFQYGFRKNHTEEYAPLDEKYTATLTEGTGKYSVDVKLDFTVAADPQVEVIFTKKQEPIVKGITVNVTVPEGTPACFFYGDMSGNTFVEMTKVDDAHYTTKFEDKESIGWGYTFCWEANNWSTQNVEGDFTVEPVDGVINVEVSGWLTNPGVEYHYTTYTHWEIMTDWDGGDWTWQSLVEESDGIFSAVAPWGTGTGVNVGSDGNPIKKNWYPAGDPYLTIQDGLNAGQAVKVTLTVIDDQTVKIDVVDANPTSADEAVEDSIYATNGTVFCSTPFEIYNLVGQNVTAQNGSLFGIYIVKTANTVKTVSVK